MKKNYLFTNDTQKSSDVLVMKCSYIEIKLEYSVGFCGVRKTGESGEKPFE